MRIHPGPTPESAIVQPTDETAAVRLDGIDPEETAACFGQAARSRPWNVDRHIRVSLASSPSDPAHRTNCRQPGGTPVHADFEDGIVELQPGGGAAVRVNASHVTPALPMPQSLMLAIGHQWARAARMSLHAAAFRIQGRSVLLLGDSEAGKTTLTLAALSLGAELLSDDWLLVHQRDGEPICTSLRDQMLLRSTEATHALLARLPDPGSLHAAHDAKVWLRRSSNQNPVDALPCDVIIHLESPERRPETTSLEPLPAIQTYARLLGGTSGLLLSSRLGSEAKCLHDLAKALVRKPAFSAKSGRDLIRNPEAVWSRLLADIETSRA